MLQVLTSYHSVVELTGRVDPFSIVEAGIREALFFTS